MTRRTTQALLVGALLLISASPAQAQNQGDACTTADKFYRVETPANSGLICDGSLLQYYLTARTTPTRLGIATGNSPNAGATLHVGGTNSILITSGTTGQRPGSPVNGMIRYNSTTNKFEGYQAGAWVDMIGGGAGGSIDGLSDGKTDYATDFNLWLGQNAGNAIASGGQYNLAIGQNAGDSITNGDYNLAIGAGALEDLTTGTGNTGIGRWAGGGISTSDYNTAVGNTALAGATSAVNNTAIGAGALEQGPGGAGNTAVGNSAGQGAGGGTFTGNYNTFIGEKTVGFFTATSADANVFVGQDSGDALTTGDQNVVIGSDSGETITTGSANILVGYNVESISATTSNHLNIGNTIYGDLSTDAVTVGTTAGQIRALPVGAQTIAATNIIAADACGSVKQITSAGAVTTSTTNTFTAPAAANTGCCMDVVNTGANNITLDANTNFKTVGAADQVVGQHDAVRVCSNGTFWYQIGAVAANN